MSKVRGPSGGPLLLRGEGLLPKWRGGGGGGRKKQGKTREGCRGAVGGGVGRREKKGSGGGDHTGLGPSQGIKQTDRRGIRISLGDDWHQTGERGNAHGTAGDARQGWGGVGRVLPSGIVSC